MLNTVTNLEHENRNTLNESLPNDKYESDFKSYSSSNNLIAQLDSLEPEQVNAHRALFFEKMHLPSIDSDQLLKNIRHPKTRSRWHHMVSHCKEFFSTRQALQEKKSIQADIADKVATKVNQCALESVSSEHDLISEEVEKSVFQSLISTPTCFSTSQPDIKKVHSYVDRALEAAETLCPIKQLAQLHEEVKRAVIQYQHNGFLKHIPWESISNDVTNHLVEYFSRHGYNNLDRETLLEVVQQSVNDNPGYTVDEWGGRFESYKDDPARWRTEGTQIRGHGGKIFELINRPTPHQWDEVQRQCGGPIGQHGTLWRAPSSTVRLGRDLSTGEVVVVKKLKKRDEADKEIKMLKQTANSKHLLSIYDFAHTTGKKGEAKSYLFMPFAGSKDLFEYLDDLDAIRETDPNEGKAIINHLAVGCMRAINELHALGITHYDIKPENFVIKGDGTITLCDLGMATNEEPDELSGTVGYCAPELINGYNSRQLSDAFSLGMTLLTFALGDSACFVPDRHLVINGDPITLNFSERSDADGNRLCKGLSNEFAALPGNTLDEVIAKLLVADPNARITTEELPNLPYFQSIM